MVERLMSQIDKELSPLRETLDNLIARAPDEDKALWHQQALEFIESILQATHIPTPDVIDDDDSAPVPQNLLRGLHVPTIR